MLEEDVYLDLLDRTADAVERSRMSAFEKNSIDLAWGIAIVSAAFGALAGGYLSKLGENLSEATISRLKRRKDQLAQTDEDDRNSVHEANIALLIVLRDASAQESVRDTTIQDNAAEKSDIVKATLKSFSITEPELSRLAAEIVKATGTDGTP